MHLVTAAVKKNQREAKWRLSSDEWSSVVCRRTGDKLNSVERGNGIRVIKRDASLMELGGWDMRLPDEKGDVGEFAYKQKHTSDSETQTMKELEHKPVAPTAQRLVGAAPCSSHAKRDLDEKRAKNSKNNGGKGLDSTKNGGLSRKGSQFDRRTAVTENTETHGHIHS